VPKSVDRGPFSGSGNGRTVRSQPGFCVPAWVEMTGPAVHATHDVAADVDDVEIAVRLNWC
jgi:hypothetical protein